MGGAWTHKKENSLEKNEQKGRHTIVKCLFLPSLTARRRVTQWMMILLVWQPIGCMKRKNT